MSKALIITEKPSVARDIVQALGGFKSQDGGAYWESDEFVCSFAVGHLFTLLEPEDIDPAYKRWRLATLPILPPTFQLKPISGQEKRIQILKRLAARKDVNVLINACDAAREGELIFREIVRYLDARQWVRRLWLQSMTPEAIRGGFHNLKDGTDLEGLAAAAECRAQSDWLIGMNATRALSLRLATTQDKTPWSVGRVQTPTLALLVRRELEILSHIPKPYQKLEANFRAPDHEYVGVWFDPNFKKDELKPELRDDRLFNRQRSEELSKTLKGQAGVASETREESLRHAPPLFSLTSLQRYMATRYKWTSQRTLQAAQRCYETHKVTTYPRTSSSCLPSDYRAEVKRLLGGLASHSDYGDYAQSLLSGGLSNEKRTFNDSGVTDHFAIIPTGKDKALSGDDEKLFDAVVRRFLANFYPPAVYDKVKRSTQVDGQWFRTGPVETLVKPGWLAVYGKQSSEKKATESLPPLLAGKKKAAGVPVTALGFNIKDEKTKPPPRINEAGLLSLMEHAGRRVEDEELASALMSAEGLGTAATRADIIQNLKVKEYVDADLRPTGKGIRLIEILERLEVARLTSAELTAKLELELAEVERGLRSSKQFMADMFTYTREIVAKAKDFHFETIYPNKDTLGTCPNCQGSQQVYERPFSYACETVKIREAGCGFRIRKEAFGRYLDRETVKSLLTQGETAELEGFKGKDGGAYRGVLRLDGASLIRLSADGSSERESSALPDLQNAGPRAGARAADEGGERQPLGLCPVHKEFCQVIETAKAFVCETRLKNFAAQDNQLQGFFLPKFLCKRTITREEAFCLMTRGMTPVLSRFISKQGKPFQAKLVLLPQGGFSFEFPPREAEHKKTKFPPRFPRNRRPPKSAKKGESI